MRLANLSFAVVTLLTMTVILFATSSRAAAQGSPAGVLTGTVSDSSGGVLPGVTVVAKGTQTGLMQETISGADGGWRIPGLPAGVYEITFELPVSRSSFEVE